MKIIILAVTLVVLAGCSDASSESGDGVAHLRCGLLGNVDLWNDFGVINYASGDQAYKAESGTDMIDGKQVPSILYNDGTTVTFANSGPAPVYLVYQGQGDPYFCHPR